MGVRQRSLRYFGQKLRLAEKLQEQARQQNFSSRSILGCITTTANNVYFRPETAERLGIRAERLCIKAEPAEVCLKDIANDLFNQKNQRRVYAEIIPNQKIAIDFSSPNIAKPFHVGHLSSTIIGNFICNLKRDIGDEVVGINYLGDWGTQFGLLSAGFQQFGDAKRLKEEPLKHLFEVYVKSNQLAEKDKEFRQKALDDFAKLEMGDKELRKMWFDFRHISLKEYFKIYSKLGVKFDLIQGESSFHIDSQELISTLRKQRFLEENRDLQGLYLSEDTFVPLMKSNGSSLYMTRDICAAISRHKQLNVNTLYYVVDNAQAKHFSDLQKCLDKIMKGSIRIVHVKFGRIKGLSTRDGQVVLLDDLIEEAQLRALKGMQEANTTRVSPEEYDKISLDLALTALYVNMLKTRRQKNETFDWEKCFSLKGDSGISLQYCHARLCSIREANEIEPNYHEEVLDEFLQDSHVCEALILLSQMEECLLRSDATLESSELVQYLFKLGHAINKAVKTARVANEKNFKLAETRLMLFDRLKESLAHGLKLIGARPLTKM
ncbi:probable arginine--tRNA ligase, mitochondrial isoform X2 [Varroa jacobsoni]|uniref:Probable arginine--tRNA ligase, mitochondrial n=1 Tax=Varroa destructor TaxID=109461 RepID=A0A7M7L3J5_VARDE|nr:probable arginine--tRNA ligase, mitochondrial isoform X2 [Varroa destructor]XP_022702700.1 probable arginine--tRNA ligase, mitochondrial isoform X2 [Varroa jacobsoni]